MSGDGNGSEWAQTFAEFHERHKDPSGKNKLKFTAVFNAAMEAFIRCPEIPLEWRVLAWIWRWSWGNNSDYCWRAGEAIGQGDCAEAFGVDKRRVNDAVMVLREFNFVLPKTGQRLYPVDDPTRVTPESPGPSGLSEDENPENPESESPGPSGLFRQFCDEWKSRAPADFQELQSAEDTVSRLRKVRLGLFRKWKRARTSGGASLYTTLQPSTTVKEPPPPVVVAEPPQPTEQPKPEEDEAPTFREFEVLYPKQQMDASKAKPLYEGLSPFDRRKCMRLLGDYLTSPRWVQDDGQYIPWAHTFLRERKFDFDPPPAFRVASAAEGRKSKTQSMLDEAERMLDDDSD